MTALTRQEIHRRYEARRPPRSDEYKAKRREYQRQNVRRNLLTQARYRAKKAGLDFDIAIDDVVIPERCPYLGLILRGAEGPSARYHSPTLDRVDNSKGYVKGNVEVISHRANTLKRDLTLRQMWLMGFALMRRGRMPR